MGFIKTVMGNMSETEKEKLGKSATKINTDGEHLVTIEDAFEIENNRFIVKFKDEVGKTADHTFWFKSKVAKDKDGKVKVGNYSVNGKETYLDKEGMEYDNLQSIGQIKNLWEIVGNDVSKFGIDGVVPSTIVYPSAGEKAIERWNSLIGKKLIIVTSYLISADQKDVNKAWRNQKVDARNFFNIDRFNLDEIKAGVTVPSAIEATIKYAKDNPGIKYGDENNNACRQELQLVRNTGTTPQAETPNTENDPF